MILQRGMRNAPLAIFAAFVIFRAPETAIPAAIFGIIKFATAGTAIFIWRARRRLVRGDVK